MIRRCLTAAASSAPVPALSVMALCIEVEGMLSMMSTSCGEAFVGRRTGELVRSAFGVWGVGLSNRALRPDADGFCCDCCCCCGGRGVCVRDASCNEGVNTAGLTGVGGGGGAGLLISMHVLC